MIYKNKMLFIICFLLACAPQRDPKAEIPKPMSTGPQLSNKAEIQLQEGLLAITTAPLDTSALRVAIFDNGFEGLEDSSILPAGTKIEPYPKSEPQATVHGTRIAEIVYELARGSSPHWAEQQELLLFNTNGLSNLEAAVDRAIALEVNVIVYAQAWEYGGNLDGKGFINAIFNRALDRGIKIMAATGNFGESAYQQEVRWIKDTADVMFDSRGKYLSFVVPEAGSCKISLAWNDFADDRHHVTNKDLDLEISDERGSVLHSSTLIQDGQNLDDASHSRHAREALFVDLEPGRYLISITAKDPLRFSRGDQFWLAIDGPRVRLDQPKLSNTVFIPADNPRVTAIGATDVGYTGEATYADGRKKPDLKNSSKVVFSNGESYDGSSSATAIAAGIYVAKTIRGIL